VPGVAHDQLKQIIRGAVDRAIADLLTDAGKDRIRRTALALLVAFIANAANAATYYDSAGRPVASSRTDMNGVTHFYGSADRPTGTARTDTNGVTHFYDGAGRSTGSMRKP